MSRISREAWGVCGLGLLVMLVAEVLRTTGIELYLWGAVWVVGWIALTLGIGLAIRTSAGWAATGISIIATLLGLYFAATGGNGSFIAMSSIAVLAVGFEVATVVQLGVGHEFGLSTPPPPYSITLGLAGVGVISLAGAFALLANGMPLGFLAFGCSLGLVGTAVVYGTGALAHRRSASEG
jgi:hypothetical protein